jgi:MoxR-like ATPase
MPLTEARDIADRMRTQVVAPLKAEFVGRDEVAELIALALTAGEHLFLYGPPGTAKSALIRNFARAVDARYFEYLLTRFSEPNEIFGPIDLVKLREGTVATVTAGMLPEAEFVFLDELFNANSAILNNLLTVLNERVYRRGAETHKLPMLSLFAASNHLPEDEALAALFDRFLLRCRVEPLARADLPRLLEAGWQLERGGAHAETGVVVPVSADDLRTLARAVLSVDLTNVNEMYAVSVGKVRDLGVELTDRRAVKVLKLVAASAVLCGRSSAEASDLWVLRYVWDRAEQIGPLGALVQGLLEQKPATVAHPLAVSANRAEGEDVSRQLDAIAAELKQKPGGLAALARLRERLAALADQAAWVADARARQHLLDRAGQLLEQIGR